MNQKVPNKKAFIILMNNEGGEVKPNNQTQTTKNTFTQLTLFSLTGSENTIEANNNTIKTNTSSETEFITSIIMIISQKFEKYKHKLPVFSKLALSINSHKTPSISMN
jgi:hypothetical protein